VKVGVSCRLVGAAVGPHGGSHAPGGRVQFPRPRAQGKGGAALLFATAQAYTGGGTTQRAIPVRPARPLLTRLLGPNLASPPGRF
jgi:hypothetical protein